MAQMSRPNSLILALDSNLFAAGFVVGLIIGKLILRNTLLAVAFGTGLGLAVATSPQDDSAARNGSA